MEDETPTTRLPDERLLGPSPVVREHDVVLLVFADGRQIFTQCTKNGKRGPLLGTLKINKSHYSTGVLVGLPYGTVLEVGKSRLQVLAHTEDVIPSYSTAATGTGEAEEGGTTPSVDQPRDNRNIVDDNKSQALDQDTLLEMRRTATDGAEMVQQIVANSASFALKTDFSRAKYIKKKQLKYQQRCRLVRCTAATICEALYMKDSKKFMNLRQDTLGQILASSNITAGTSVLVWESTWGLVTGAIAERLGGYGRIFSVYTGDQPAHNEIVGRFNLSFRAQSSIKWVHASDVYKEAQGDEDEEDVEAKDRDALNWPCNLQDHTRTHLMTLESDRKRLDFLAKRAARFARKITRHSPLEAKTWLHSRQCDSLVIAVKKYDAAKTLLALLHHLSPSCPFVVYSEFMEPLTECFRAVQSHAINLRLSDTWAREYQVLPGRTHPKMDMRQSGGFLLTGIKLDETYGHNELDEELLLQLKQEVGGHRARHNRSRRAGMEGKKRRGESNGANDEPKSKRVRQEVDDSSKTQA